MQAVLKCNRLSFWKERCRGGIKANNAFHLQWKFYFDSFFFLYVYHIGKHATLAWQTVRLLCLVSRCCISGREVLCNIVLARYEKLNNIHILRKACMQFFFHYVKWPTSSFWRQVLIYTFCQTLLSFPKLEIPRKNIYIHQT